VTERPGEGKPDSRRRGLAIVAVLLLLIVAGAAAYAYSNESAAGTTSTTITRFSIGADSVISASASQDSSGYALESTKANASASADWAVLGASDGSVANVTALAFASSNDSEAYFSRLVSNLKGLPGYIDVSSALSSYRQFGGCYAYGEDVDGIAVANGICTKGNVFLQVHLVSSKPFSDLESDMSSLMGVLFDNVA
jgi:hypothetical protein